MYLSLYAINTYLYESRVEVDSIQCEEVVAVSNNGRHTLLSSTGEVRELGNLGQTLTCRRERGSHVRHVPAAACAV